MSKVAIDRNILKVLLACAEHHVEDVETGIEEGLYIKSENTDLQSKQAACAAAAQLVEPAEGAFVEDITAPCKQPPVPRVLVVVRGGIAEPVFDEGVEVAVFDWDNYKSDPESTGGVSTKFAELAKPLGIPVAPDEEAIETSGQVRYVIRSLSEAGEPLGAPGAFWSNADGWGCLETATHFSTRERMSLNFPLSARQDAEWMLVEEAKDLAAEASAKAATLPAFSLVKIGADWLPDDVTVSAYSNGRHWNGWAMPRFTLEAGHSLLKHMPDLSYNGARDAFISKDAQDDQAEEEVFAAETLIVGGSPIKTYAIGAGSWCWYLAE
ncbi:hypothetical protein [Alicycliphilus denitrificans]|uniref:hypothetical protein n=1 Tax=Alicycliphilus denitrificans TaxID=179636 RepID=UPI0001D9E922|nr:hypothetical protein [Alicycliphilus denitrificans]ADV02160.1 hypothetical protein Alide_4558 [Alicycliphilus denitrificans BC]